MNTGKYAKKMIVLAMVAQELLPIGNHSRSPLMTEIEFEYGGLPIRNIELDVTLYDSQGNIIEIPKCSNCLEYKVPVIGENWISWICTNGCTND
jgi:hypothetical protein